MDKGDPMTHSRITFHNAASNVGSFVRRIVQYLDLQLFAGVIKPADRIHQAIDNELLVKNWQLNGDTRQVSKVFLRLDPFVFLVAVIHPDKLIPMQSVKCQQNQYDEVRDQQGHVEGVCFIESLKGRIENMGAQIMAESALLREHCKTQIGGERSQRLDLGPEFEQRPKA